MLTHYRRKRRNHRFRRPSLTKPHRKFTFVHPSDLPLARSVWMVQTRLGLHPSAFARFVSWRLQGSGTGLDTGRSMTTSHAHSCWCDLASRPPQRTGQAGILASGSSMGQRTLAAHGGPIGLGVRLDVTAAEPATDVTTVAEAAPAWAIAAQPTFLRRPLEPVG
jgi:hypothetical protein